MNFYEFHLANMQKLIMMKNQSNQELMFQNQQISEKFRMFEKMAEGNISIKFNFNLGKKVYKDLKKIKKHY